MSEEEYTDSLKQVVWEAYWAGYTLGYGVEDMKPIDKQTARSHFERWWKRNAD